MQSDQTWIIKIFKPDPDAALTALLEYSNLVAHTLKVESCYLSSYHLYSYSIKMLYKLFI